MSTNSRKANVANIVIHFPRDRNVEGNEDCYGISDQLQQLFSSIFFILFKAKGKTKQYYYCSLAT